MMLLPNFLIIGAQKSGTTSLWYYLKQHPEIYLTPCKEPHFFAFEGKDKDYFRKFSVTKSFLHKAVFTYEGYLKLFNNVKDEKAVGECSATYFASTEAPLRIKKYIPNVKIIAILRNPVDRAYSHFLMRLRNGTETLSNFELALKEADKEDINSDYNFALCGRSSYKQVGLYFKYIKRYFEVFDKGKIRIYFYEDLCNKPLALLKDIFTFLEVDYNFIPDVSFKANPTWMPKNEFIRKIFFRYNIFREVRSKFLPFIYPKHLGVYFNIKESLFEPPPLLPFGLRRQLVDYYRDDILKLQDLIKKDLTEWIS